MSLIVDSFKRVLGIPTDDEKAVIAAAAKSLAELQCRLDEIENERLVIQHAEEEKEAKILADKEALKNMSDKERSTLHGEPWVNVTAVDLDYDNITDGSFSLDWNDIFIAKLSRAGYKGKTDSDLVDQWFRAVCSNVVAENWEQYNADPEHRQPKQQYY